MLVCTISSIRLKIAQYFYQTTKLAVCYKKQQLFLPDSS